MSVVTKKQPHIFVDELAAIESENRTFLRDLAKLFEKYCDGKTKRFWITVDDLQSLDISLFGFSEVNERTCISQAAKTHLSFVHRCTANVYDVSIDGLS